MATTPTSTKSVSAMGPTGKIRRAHLSMQRCADAIFAPRNVTTDQFSLLWIVWKREGIRQNELAEELFTDPNTVTAMVARLEKRGLIRREVCAEDARARRVTLTPTGRRLVAKLSDEWDDMRKKLRAVFAGEDGEKAMRILDEVQRIMSEGRQAALDKQKRPSASRRIARTAAESTIPVDAELVLQG